MFKNGKILHSSFEHLWRHFMVYKNAVDLSIMPSFEAVEDI